MRDRCSHQRGQLHVDGLCDQLARASAKDGRERVGPKSRWIGELGDGTVSPVAYPFLGRELRRLDTAMTCRPLRASPTFSHCSFPCAESRTQQWREHGRKQPKGGHDRSRCAQSERALLLTLPQPRRTTAEDSTRLPERRNIPLRTVDQTGNEMRRAWFWP